jgi:arginine exporter protein ArgO
MMQRAARAVGAAFLLVGILGFVPGVTQDLGDIAFAGHDSEAELLGLFQVSILHNLVHLLFGVLGLLAARAYDTSRNFLVVGGVVYLGLWLYGLVIDHQSDANFVPVNDADNWLHFGLGAAMVALGLGLSREAQQARR